MADSESAQKTVQTRTGIIDLSEFCVELWPKQVLHRISVPIYIVVVRIHKTKTTQTTTILNNLVAFSVILMQLSDI